MVITPAENPSRSCQSTNSGVAAVGSIITAVTGQAASQTARRSRTVAVITPPADPMYEESRTSTNGVELSISSTRLVQWAHGDQHAARAAPPARHGGHPARSGDGRAERPAADDDRPQAAAGFGRLRPHVRLVRA